MGQANNGSQRYDHVLTPPPPQTCDYYLIWEKGSLQLWLNEGSLRWSDYSRLSKWDLNAIPNVIIRERQRKRQFLPRREGDVKMEAEVWVMQLRNTGSSKRLGDLGNGFLPRASTRCASLLTTWFWTSALQNCEKINCCCFKIPSLSQFVTTTPRN